MRRLILAAALTLPFAAWAETVPTYQAPPGLTAGSSATGATPTTGSSTAMPATPAQPAAKPATPAAPAGAGSGAAKVKQTTQQKVVTSVIQEEPIADNPAIEARLPGLKSQPSLADIGDKLDYVVISGVPAATQAGGTKRVGIEWTIVTRTDTGQTITLPTPLSSALRVKGDTLPAKSKVTARGDADELYKTIRLLFENSGPGLQTAAATGGAAKNDAKGGSTPTTNGQQSSQGDVSTKQLKQTEMEDDEEKDSYTEYGSTTESCKIRIDLGQMAAVQQEAPTETTDGKTEVGACSDGSTRYPILKTQIGCDDVLGESEAQGQSRLYYVGSDGKPIEVEACAPDAELVYPIVEEAGTCTTYVDASAGRVFDQAERVYRNNKSVRIVVEACRPTGEGYPIAQTAEGCELKDDFTKAVTTRQIRDYYEKGGVQYFVSACHDSEESYPHQEEACQVEVDLENRVAYEASRIFIDTPTGKQYRSLCSPKGNGIGLVATTGGCELIHYDYPSAMQSRGAERLYYNTSDGQTIFVTNCQENTTVYPWQFERTGYQHNDEAKTSTELLKASITLASQTVEVAAAAVWSNSALIPYTLDSVQDVPNAQAKTYMGCDAYAPTTKTETYKRADATTYTLGVGPGTPSGPVDECTRTTETQTLASHSCRGGGPNCAAQFTSPAGMMKIGAFQKSESGSHCAAERNTTSGTAWSQRQTRTVTQYPAGAGGGTTTTAWALDSYVQAGSWTYTYTTEESVRYGSTCGQDDKACTKTEQCSGYDSNAMPW